MQVHYGLDKIPLIQKPVVTSGTFDGVHLGHKTILDRLKEVAEECGGETVVLTYWPHPRYVLGQKSKNELKLLSSLDEKVNLLAAYGINHLVILPFTKEFSQQSSKQFIDNIIRRGLKTFKLVIGYDHKFGRNREGSFDYLLEHQSELGFAIEEIPRADVDHVGISSTKIREALENGDVADAYKFLGDYYPLTGKVVMGDQLGRKIGFPTANIKIDETHKLVPSDGVYAVYVVINDVHHQGMLNIGVRPTVDGLKRTIEVHIFDFSEQIYGDNIEVRFIDRVREEQKFASVTELQQQLVVDKKNVIRLINS